MASVASSKSEKEFCDPIDGRFICTICTQVLCDPHLTGCCGQHFCESCLKNWFTKQSGKKSCPHCRAERKEFQYLLDKKLKREIDSLKIHCTNKEEGCQWVGEAGSLKDHLKSDNGCSYVKVKCLNNRCLDRVKRKDLKDHLKTDCIYQPYQCERCGFKDTYHGITGRYSMMSDCGVCADDYHYKKCPEFPLECPNKCDEKDIKRKDMEDHRSQCPEEWVKCPFAKAGCWKKCVRRELEQHLLTVQQVQQLKNGLKTGCIYQPYHCEYCGFKDTYRGITGRYSMSDTWALADDYHYKKCPEFPLECPNKCGKKDIKGKDMEEHRSQCPEEPVQCPFVEAGCKEKLLRRELEQHMSTLQQVQQHLLMVMGAYKEMKKANDEINKANEELKKFVETKHNCTLSGEPLSKRRKTSYY